MVIVSHAVDSYIAKHPHIRHALAYGIVNYSKLARLIGKEAHISKFDALQIACRRYDRTCKTTWSQSHAILAASSLAVRNNMAAIILKPTTSPQSISQLSRLAANHHELMHLVRGPSAITAILPQSYLDAAKRIFGKDIIKIHQQLGEIALRTPAMMEDLPGVSGYLYSILGEAGINIVETMSCYTDTLLLISEKDIAATVGLLQSAKDS